MSRALADVQTERDRQDAKWGEQNHLPEVWYAILGEEFGEVGTGILNATLQGQNEQLTRTEAWEQYREELIQVAAVAVAAVESYDRGNWQ